MVRKNLKFKFYVNEKKKHLQINLKNSHKKNHTKSLKTLIDSWQ